MHERMLVLASLWCVPVIAGPILIVLALASWWYESARGPHGPSLDTPTAIAVSASEEVFVYTEWDSIRVFDRHGAELRKWSVRTGNGAASLASTRLESCTSSPRETTDWSARGPSGDLYVIRGGAILRVSPSGEEPVVPALPTWLPVGPMSPLVILIVGLFLPAFGAALRSYARLASKNAAT